MTTKDKEKKSEISLTKIRDYKVVKSNDLIQKSRFQLSLQEQKIILYLISKIKPEDMELKEHTFEIIDFCTVCGIEINSGKNYKNIKDTIKSLADKSVWLTLENGSETLMRWINRVTINKKSGVIILKLDEMMKPYLLNLQERFTQYELLYTLAMRSQYSLRLYEILKSYEYKHNKTFDIDELKRILSAETYDKYADFKRKVLDIAMREINELSDLIITYEVIKTGHKYSGIEFYINVKKDTNERLKTWAKIEKVISPKKTSVYEKIHGEKP